MKLKFYLSKTLLIPLLLLGIVSGVRAQTLDLSKSVFNVSTGLSGLNAVQNNILEYTIVVRNLSGSNITNAKLYDNIPAGSSYVAGTTTMNGASVPDVGGKMPFSNGGGAINSDLYLPGVLAPNVPATITFRVKVTANAGSVSNFASLTGTYNSTGISQNTNTVFTNLTADAACNVIYESTANSATGCPSGCTPQRYYRQLRSVNTTTGYSSSIIYDGASGNCYNAFDNTPLADGSVLTYASALAFDRKTNRIYFINNIINNPPEDLCYIDLASSPASVKRYVGFPLETNDNNGFNINRMAFASDGYGYAVTSNGEDLIRFAVDPVTNIPDILRMGPLLNDPNNGANDILNETGGDIFGDGSGMLYLIANASKLYKINPNNRISTFLGTISPKPPANSNSIAIDASGQVYIGGAYNAVYRINLTTMASTLVAQNQFNIYTNGDYTSCAFPVLAPALTANKTYRNINGSAFVVGGDTVEYTIEVTNTGNINAANVKLYDSIPSTTLYIPGSTKLNNSTVPDVLGVMPFSVVGGRYVNSPGEANGILKPGSANKAVVKFRVKVSPLHQVCNQSRITLIDGDGNLIFINSDDPSAGGTQNPTCFFSDGVLPLNNLQFRGSLNKDLSVLQWTGNEDQNVSAYEIQYSDNGIHFTPLDLVAARQTDGFNNSYQFTDMKNTIAGNRFYRLKIIQKGGSQNYSGIIRLNLKGSDIQVMPNPFDKELNLQFQLKTSEMVRIRLVDSYGREVFGTTERLSTGSHSLILNLPAGLSTGMYVLEVLAGKTQLYQKKLMKR